MTFNERVPSPLCFFVTLICSLNLTSSSNSTGDTLTQGQNLTSTNCLISSSGDFTLCFFQPDGSLDNKFYLGILSHNYYIWVANRDMPIHGPGSLTIDEHGNLKILSTKEHATIVLYNSSVEAEISTTNVSAVLLDTGNFVLRETKQDGSVKVLWQSFDYPTDTLISGMKLGFDGEKGQIWSLTSRRSDNSVSSGSFILGLDPKTKNQLVMWWRGKILWTSGNWSNGRFSNLYSSLYAQDFNFTYFSNGRMTYFMYAPVSNFINIGPAGSINGASGSSYSCLNGYFLFGCSMPRSPKCREDVGLFFPSSNSFGVMSREGFKFDDNENLTISDCWMKCLNNCSCEAYSYANLQDQTGCEIWGKGAKNYLLANATRDGREIFFFHSTGTNVSAGKTTKRWVISGTVVGALLLIISSFMCFKLRRKHKEKAEKQKKRTNVLYDAGNTIFPIAYNETRQQSNEERTSDDAHIFDFETILETTDNFSFSNKIGEGGFGPVYKGKLPNGQEIAIKRLSKSSGQGLLEFKNEAMLIVKLQHTNLVRLLGFCIHREERILVYEYMPNRSLNLYLFDPNKRIRLEWKIRCQIIEGIAQGLVYLHQYSRLKVIHRDLKASNILLDDELNPKISDFGTARIFGLIEFEEKTNRIVGTYGYMSPEYAMMGLISTKTDVYSFGILLLEIVSGKKNNIDYSLNLVVYAWKLWNEGEALKLIDTMLEGSCPPIQVLRYIHIGLLCTQDQARDRPTMVEVISFLSNETAHLPSPKQPGVYTIVAGEEIEQNKICSINEVTISMMSGR